MHGPLSEASGSGFQGVRPQFEYDVVLSFAGEQRAYVERVAHALKRTGLNVFYDSDEEIMLWNSDMYTMLDDIYRFRSRRAVAFVSDAYARKPWPRHERRSLQARALEDPDYLLYARFDDTKLPGLPPTIHCMDLRNRSPEEFAKTILVKLGKKSSSVLSEPPATEHGGTLRDGIELSDLYLDKSWLFGGWHVYGKVTNCSRVIRHLRIEIFQEIVDPATSHQQLERIHEAQTLILTSPQPQRFTSPLEVSTFPSWSRVLTIVLSDMARRVRLQVRVLTLR